MTERERLRGQLSAIIALQNAIEYTREALAVWVQEQPKDTPGGSIHAGLCDAAAICDRLEEFAFRCDLWKRPEPMTVIYPEFGTGPCDTCHCRVHCQCEGSEE